MRPASAKAAMEFERARGLQTVRRFTSDQKIAREYDRGRSGTGMGCHRTFRLGRFVTHRANRPAPTRGLRERGRAAERDDDHRQVPLPARAATHNRIRTDGGVVFTDDDEIWEDVAETLRVVTQETRHALLLDIIAHPRQAPSAAELSFMNPSVDNQSAISKHLDALCDVGVVKKVTLEKGERRRDAPYVFYTLTEDGRVFLEKHDLIPEDPAPLQETYQRVEKPEKIERYEQAPRPDEIPDVYDRTDELIRRVQSMIEDFNQTGDATEAAEEIEAIEDGGITADVEKLEALQDSLDELITAQNAQGQ